MGIVIEYPELIERAHKLRKDKKIVFTNGCFDLLHIGHIRYLKKAKTLGDVLIVGVNTDHSVKQLKGPSRPIQKEEDRAEILSALACVDFVCLFNDTTPLKMIEEVSPHVLVKGGDWKIKDIVGADGVLASGGDVHSLPFTENSSSTNLIEKIQKL